MNTIKLQVEELRNTSLKNHDTLSLTTARAILNAITLEEKSGIPEDMHDVIIVKILRKLVKQREEAADIYENAGAQNQADIERQEAEIIKRFLPRMLDEWATKMLVETIVSDLGLEPPFHPSMKGKVLKKLKGRTDVDMKIVSSLVEETINNA